ncbi:unnamed protein product [Brachionus calyciflorus]|uniref:Acetyl-coenzyme A transporter 1 n=1 Tax=Brachionus calyciflorus TaxID=104777 RepID=A0A814BN31_9BILA|nr:unnamed protein product [Brachionus calyciflorus]
MITREPHQDDVLSLNSFRTDLNEEPKKKEKDKINSRNEDLINILFLIFLYVIQTVPFGVASSIPLILSSRKVSYSDQGVYSFAMWPFSIKLLWAPLVDRFFIQRIGRRKTWVIGCQFVSGLIMICLANYVNKLIDSNEENKKNNIYILTLIFGVLVFLCATQDTALDAWSLDLLMEKNLHYQALCNSMGMGLGQFIGNAGFLIFESVDFSNKIREFLNLKQQDFGIVNIKILFYVFGCLSIVVSLIVLVFKTEHNEKRINVESECSITDSRDNQFVKQSILNTYKTIWKILLIKPIRILITLVLTLRITFSTESIIRLKLVENGFSREKLSLMKIILSPIFICVPIILSRFTKGPEPLFLFRRFIAFKILIICLFSIFLFNLNLFKNEKTLFSLIFYLSLFLLSIINEFLGFAAQVSMGSFHAKISDRLIGGTYMTFLTFWPHLGSSLSKTSALFFINLLTFKKCNVTNLDIKQNDTISRLNSTDISTFLVKTAKCEILFDPFYPLTILLIIFGVFWVIISKNYFDLLQKESKSQWKITLN